LTSVIVWGILNLSWQVYEEKRKIQLQQEHREQIKNDKYLDSLIHSVNTH
jgi:hypothetical protein